MTELRNLPSALRWKIFAHQRWLESGGTDGERLVKLPYAVDGVWSKEDHFFRCRMEKVDLSFAILPNVSFISAQLQNAWFIGAQLEGCRFEFSHLTGTRFDFAELECADFDSSKRDKETSFYGAMIDRTHWSQGSQPEHPHIKETLESYAALRKNFEVQNAETLAVYESIMAPLRTACETARMKELFKYWRQEKAKAMGMPAPILSV